MNDALATLGTGFARPVHSAQQAFRTVLQAFSHPGRVLTLSAETTEGVQAPPPLNLATTIALLTLLDGETSVHLAGVLHSDAALAYLRFHCGVRSTPLDQAGYTVVHGADLPAAGWPDLPLGSDEQPQLGATLVVEVDGLDERVPLPGAVLLRLQGPGIAVEQTLAVVGPPVSFWAWRRALQREYPRGFELLLTCGDRLATLPRSTQIFFEDEPERPCTSR